MKDEAAPWFYRKRFTVFGLIYGLAFFLGFLIAGVAGLSPEPVYRSLGHPLLFAALAAGAVLTGLALRVWASSYMSSSIVLSEDPVSAQLRVAGPYRFTRNPLYLGNVLQAAGVALVTPWTAAVMIVAGVVAFDYALIFVEERLLAATRSAAYARYRATVPRLFPLPGKSAPADPQTLSLREGLRTEATIGFFVLAMFALALAASEWIRR